MAYMTNNSWAWLKIGEHEVYLHFAALFVHGKMVVHPHPIWLGKTSKIGDIF
jgi:hypothetical protein